MRPFIIIIAVVGGILILGLFIRSQVVYTLSENDQVLVLRFGEVRAVHAEPGQYTKAPMVDGLVYYPKAPVRVEAPVARFIDRDRGMPEINLSLHYRITDPVQFRRTLLNERSGSDRLGDIALATLRDELAHRTRPEILTDPGIPDGTPDAINQQVLQSTKMTMERRISRSDFGVDIVDLAATATYHSN